MRKITIFEASIIGFLIGSILATYMAFIRGTEGFIGSILRVASLEFLLQYLPVVERYDLLVPFLFFILVGIFYAIIIAIVNKVSNKAKYLVILGIIVIFSIAIQQTIGVKNNVHSSAIDDFLPAAVIKSSKKELGQYFGTEKIGDINGDGIDDIVFVVQEETKKEGVPVTYQYVAASIKEGNSYRGTNIVFVGKDIEITKLEISSSTAYVTYTKDGDAEVPEEDTVSVIFLDNKLRVE
ncbi:MAG TPA: hypothetical protein PLF31_02385 [Candidatus Paceibacterota bacterium]|nr:hypothetical protein [Candidatus Paceibacterota bacterium]